MSSAHWKARRSFSAATAALAILSGSLFFDSGSASAVNHRHKFVLDVNGSTALEPELKFRFECDDATGGFVVQVKNASLVSIIAGTVYTVSGGDGGPDLILFGPSAAGYVRLVQNPKTALFETAGSGMSGSGFPCSSGDAYSLYGMATNPTSDQVIQLHGHLT